MKVYEEAETQVDHDHDGKLVYYQGPVQVDHGAMDNEYFIQPNSTDGGTCIFIWRQAEMYQFSRK